MLSDDDAFTIEYERLRSVFQQAPVTLSVTIINACIVGGVLGFAEASMRPAVWIALVVAVCVVRLFGARAFLGRPALTVRYSGMVFSVVTSLMNGILWGVGAAELMPADPAHQLFLALAIGGMCAGAVTVNGAHLPTLLAYILPSSLPLAWNFFGRGPPWQASAVMIVIFAAALSLIGVRAHRTFGDGLRLRLALSREQRRLRQANEALQSEMAHRRTAEATLHQAQKMEAIGHLTGGIAHDFNNLLQVMIGNLNLIRRLSGENKRVVTYALAAETAAVRGAELTSSLLTFARRQVLDAEQVNLNDLLREFEPILLRTLGTTVNCTIVLAADLPCCRADPSHFQSAVLNLVINARDAMPNGGRLAISTGHAMLKPADLGGNPDAVPGHFVYVSVRDTGVGIRAEVLAHVFEPFFTTKDVGKGSGLGLSQVYGFARQSGGHIQLLSKPDEGTEAILWLPVSERNVLGQEKPAQDVTAVSA